ncbi:hypothetical protein H5410_014086 [Solanum commersonii]|uniref:AAA+ ATPase domain-containing protein n=1 Tax=Solanum commersonii TaxID=4109 RepID=A0A9J5ZQ05_SOLCO|nr:hypothetical protein H5410_014086 [Solanum commersonii]
MALSMTVLSTVGSIAAITMFVHSIIHDYIPRELHEYLFFGLRNMFTKFSNQLTMVIDKFNGLVNNEIYEAVETYFGNNLSPNIHQLKISKPEKEKNFNLAMERNEETFRWNRSKDMILKDLERFVKRKYYYRKVGNEWKRGYLLFGPPGTEKSGLIVAMANYLNFDIYDLELTSLRGNMELQRLLVAIANKSILVVEDNDCTIDLQDNLANRATVVHSINGFRMQENKVTLSGLLNFIDGLWSSCGAERIIIFTTNHIEKLNPALLRPGRMDMHIHMACCTPCGFKLLATNYLGIKDHKLFKEIEELIHIANVTPAEVAEQLLKEDEVENSLKGLINFLHKKIKENEEVKAKKVEITQVESVDEEENVENEIKEKEEEKDLPNGEST